MPALAGRNINQLELQLRSYRYACFVTISLHYATPRVQIFPLFLFPSIDHNNTANMVKTEPNQTASLIAVNNDSIAYLKMGELNESYSLLSEAVATLQNLIREQPPKSTPFRYNFQMNDLSYSIANRVFKSSEQSGLVFLFQ